MVRCLRKYQKVKCMLGGVQHRKVGQIHWLTLMEDSSGRVWLSRKVHIAWPQRLHILFSDPFQATAIMEGFSINLSVTVTEHRSSTWTYCHGVRNDGQRVRGQGSETGTIHIKTGAWWASNDPCCCTPPQVLEMVRNTRSHIHVNAHTERNSYN